VRKIGEPVRRGPQAHFPVSGRRADRAQAIDARGVTGASLADVDLLRFQLEYLPSAVPPAVLAENGRSREQQMRALRLLEGAMKTIAFFNNKGGVGKTSLAYQVSWMMSLLGVKTLVADLDPQANATSVFLSPDEIFRLWESDHDSTVYGSMKPIISGIGDIRVGKPVFIADKLFLVPGDLYVVIPLSADMFSIKGLENVGPILRQWRADWRDRIPRAQERWGLSCLPGL
jgi:AAA domain